MKRIKRVTSFTRRRDWIRAVFTFMFYGLVLIPHLMGYSGLELESEYVVLASIVLLGPWFCGWACPFGNASYFMSRLGNKLFPKGPFQIPQKVHVWLSYTKYGLLAYFVWVLNMNSVNYFGDHMEMYKTNLFTMGYIKFKHIAVLIIPLFIPRFFCKYLCFQKGAYNLINRILPPMKIKRDNSTCIACKKCDKVCPMQLQPSQKDQVKGNDCLSCFNCLDTDVCPPKHRALHFRLFGIKIDPLKFGLFATGLYVLVSLIVYVIG